MRVAYLNPGATLGGAELSLLDILASFRAARSEFELHLVLGQDGPLVQRARDLGVEVTVLPFPTALARMGDAGTNAGRLRNTARLAGAGLAAMRYGKELRAHLRTVAPDLVHTNGFKMHVLGARYAPAGTPVIWNVRDYLSSRPMMARLLHGYAHRAAGIVTNSKSVTDDVRSVVGPGARIDTIYNAIDLEEFSPEGAHLDLDALSGLDPATAGTVRVGLAGTLARWKGHEVFLRALSLLPAELPVRGYIIGGALYQTPGSQYQLDELKTIASGLNLPPGRIGFTGYVDRPAAALRALDIVVHASTQPEPFGRVVAEAMACGRAVIASRSGGVTEILEEGVTALAHTPGEAADLASQIELLAIDAELRSRLGRVGRATAERRFDRGRLAIEFAEIYRSVISTGK
jgi:glycosyltransferase involved in cell wall biosynthesis